MEAGSMRKASRYIVPYLIVWGSLFLHSISLASTTPFQQFNVVDGLPSSYVYCIIQDRDGFIWASTDAGVVRYDGYTFQTFTSEDGLPDDEIFQLHQDSKGRIWFLSYNGRPGYYLNGKFYNLENDNQLAKALMGSFFVSYLEDKEGNIWLQSQRSGIVKLHDSGEVSFVAPPPEESGVFRPAAMLWEESDGVWRSFCGINENLTTGQRITFDCDRIMQLYGGQASGQGVYQAFGRFITRIQSGKMDTVCVLPERYQSGEEVLAIREVEDQNLLISTVHGCVEYNPKTGKQNAFLSDYTVSWMTEDLAHGLWVATAGQGIFYFPASSFTNYSKGNGLPGMEVSGIKKGPEGKIFVGQTENRWAFIDSLGRIESFQLPGKFRATRSRLFDFEIDSNGSWWIIGSTRFGYSSDQGGTWQYSSEMGGEDIALTDHGCFVASSKGTFFFPYSSISKKNHGLGRLSSLKKPLSRIQSGSIVPFFKKETYIASRQGLLHIEKGSIKPISDFPDLNTRLTALAKGPDSTLWICSYNTGLMGLKNKKLIRIEVGEKGRKRTNCAAANHEGNVWVGTNHGLYFIEDPWSENPIQTRFSVLDGLISDRITSLLLDGSKLWIGTSSGVSKLDLDRSLEANTSCPVYITRFRVNGEKISWVENPQLEPNQTNISIDFVGLSYRSLGHIEYQYLLEGADTTWRKIAGTQVEFPDLSPGSYCFKVRARAYNGTWNEAPAQVSFHIATPLWKRSWFLALVQIGLILVISLITISRIKKLKRKNRLEQRIAEVEHSALRAQMNPHFVFNALNTIQGYIIDNDQDGAYETLQKFSKVIRQSLEQSRHRLIPLKDELETLQLYMDIEVKRFSDKIKVKVDVTEGLDTSSLFVPPMLIQPYVENAIRHGLKPKKSGGEVVVRITMANERLCISVQDSGIGRKASAALKQRQIVQHNSLGLTLTKERLQLLNRTRKKTDLYEVEIVDLKDDTGQTTGTLVKMFFPITLSS